MYELSYLEKWSIYQNFKKLPWEWFGDEYPLVQDQHAMLIMAGWDNDRERMTQEMDQQKARSKSGYSSNIRGQKMHIE